MGLKGGSCYNGVILRLAPDRVTIGQASYFASIVDHDVHFHVYNYMEFHMRVKPCDATQAGDSSTRKDEGPAVAGPDVFRSE